ncbi:uncharacterized protein V1513DRAFT_476705 [Lipomyces chichibuensis]|uniref:uncharacterized protein n=1 Tax=Lipomyces chichibuensis TaxID=1546026 RepID=UPI0033430594
MAPSHSTSTFVAIQPAGPVLEAHASPSSAIAPRNKPETPTDIAVSNCIRPSKEWVLPPRPKPGRKPSTETPPTKRKAQNRAAQRAFRERRAARVVELEERLQELESEKEEKETRLTSTLMRISAENQELKYVTDELKQQLELFKQFQAQQGAMGATGQGVQTHLALAIHQAAHHLASPAPSPGSNEQTYSHEMLDRVLEERLPVDGRSRALPASTIATTVSSTGTQHLYVSPSTGTVPIRRRLKEQRRESTSSCQSTVSSPHIGMTNSPSSYTHRSSISHAVSHPSPLNTPDPEQDSGHSDKCGLCHTDGNCLCSDIGITPAIDIFPKRPPSLVSATTAESHNKRLKVLHEEDLEMDFTHAFQTAKIVSVNKGTYHPQPRHQHQLRRQDYHSNDATDFRSALSSDQSEMKTNVRVADPCGFCSSGTPCLCAEAADAEANNSMMDSQVMENSVITTLPPLRNDPRSRNAVQNKLHTLHPEPINDVTVASSSAPANNFAPGTCEACQRDPMQTLFCTSLASGQQNSTGSTGCGNCNQPGGCCGGSNGSTDRDTAFIPCSAAYRTLSRHRGFKAVELPSLVGKLSTRGGKVEVASVASILRELDRRLYS